VLIFSSSCSVEIDSNERNVTHINVKLCSFKQFFTSSSFVFHTVNDGDQKWNVIKLVERWK
jgi:hypothetical protein